MAGPDGAVTAYGYDADGNTMVAGAARYGWDLAGRPSMATTPQGATLEFGYDGDGDRVATRSADGTRAWQWDLNGRCRCWRPRAAPSPRPCLRAERPADR